MPGKKRMPRAPGMADKKPRFERRDVVQVIGIPSPLMLVIDVSKETDENGEFTLGVVHFQGGGLIDSYGEPREFAEGLLQLVKPAAKVVEEAEAATRAARAAV